MNHYEVTFIIDPVLSGDEIKSTASIYETLLKDQGCSIVHVQEMGLRQLAYPINKKSSGVYYCVEYSALNGASITKMELALRRDERIMRFLTTRLDKYGIQYNEDRRSGKISAYKKKEAKKKTYDNGPAPAAVKDEVITPAGKAEIPAPVVVAAEIPVMAPIHEEIILPIVAEVVQSPEFVATEIPEVDEVHEEIIPVVTEEVPTIIVAGEEE